MKILLTGAAGLLGNALLPVLATRHDVLATFRDKPITTLPGNASERKLDLTDGEAVALATYIKSFALSNIPDDLRRPADSVHIPDGREIFATYCSACHGADGMGTSHPELSQIGPAIACED